MARWCNWLGESTEMIGPGPALFDVSHGHVLASAQDVTFRDPNHFVSGELCCHADRWKDIPQAPPEILSFVTEGVDAWSFFTHFKGKFGTISYDSPQPPRMIFDNSSSCSAFEQFIQDTIIARVANGSLKYWGLVGEVEAPYLVMPITIEPTKPRMCHDERFLNLWVKDLPFTLDYLSDLPRYVGPNNFQTVCDEKSGYDHISLTRESQTLFGLEWKGCYFVYCTLHFGWKASAYIYQSVGLIATSYIRSFGVPCSQYIDDRHHGQLITSPLCEWSYLQKAEAAIYIATTILTSLGYTLALLKSVLIPTQVVRFLGYISNSLLCAFILPDDKKLKFQHLREAILSCQEIDLKTLQKFAGKTTSFSIAVPAARLYTRVCYRAIGTHCKTPRQPIRVSGELRDEILYWRFLDAWEGHLPWFDERHRVITTFTDASHYAWGAQLTSEDGQSRCIRDYWGDSDRPRPIVIKEALALRNALQALGASLQGSRVDGHVDSLPLVQAWKNQGGRSKALSEVVKSIHELALQYNIALSLTYVPSADNLADAPSRSLSQNDCQLAPEAWVLVEDRWGPHSLDLMALDSNSQLGQGGLRLPHYTPWPTANTSGVNAFAQPIPWEHNVYVFPPLALVGPLLRFLTPCPPSYHRDYSGCLPSQILVADCDTARPRFFVHWQTWRLECALISFSRQWFCDKSTSVGSLGVSVRA